MDACPNMETNGGRNQKDLLAQLVNVFGGVIDASDSPTFSSRNIETPTDADRDIWEANPGGPLSVPPTTSITRSLTTEPRG